MIERFSPYRQAKYCKDLFAIHDDRYPCLSEINLAYGADSAAQWLIPHLVDLAIFTGVKDKLTNSKLVALAEVIQSQYKHLTVVEMMSFFLRFKAGFYSEFYGSVDPLVITCSLKIYCRERDVEMCLLERQKERLKMDEQRAHQLKVRVTYEEYQRQKQAGLVPSRSEVSNGENMQSGINTNPVGYNSSDSHE